jgi:hypothetical protein
MDASPVLILSMSADGDALSYNVPGTYDLPATFGRDDKPPDTPGWRRNR